MSKIKSVKDWSKHSQGAWVLNMCKDLLKKHGWDDPDLFFDTKSQVFGDMTAVEFVQHLVEIGNAESYADAWHYVLGTIKRMYG